MHGIRIQSFVAAERAAVWDALVLRTDVVLDALPGARWPEPHVAEPPMRLNAPWPHTTAAGGPTEVAVALEAMHGGTRMNLEHRGFGEGPAWEEAIGGHFAGWLQALAALGVLVESGVDARCAAARRGGERYFASGEIPADADAVWRALTDPSVIERWSDGALDGAVAREAIEGRFLRLDLAATELTLILRRTPRGTHLALAEYDVSGRDASQRWPPLFERLTRYLR